MTEMRCIEIVPPSVGAGKVGVIIHGEFSRTPLWFGEATYSEVFEASGRQLLHRDDEDGVYEAMYGPIDGFPLWALHGEADCTSHIYYFDDERVLQGVALEPVRGISVKVGDLVMEPYYLERRNDGYQYPIFDTLVVKARSYLDQCLEGDRLLLKYRGLYRQAGIFFAGGAENADLLYSLGCFSQEWLSVPLEALGWTNYLREREERRLVGVGWEAQPF
ncbi:hypothetical protein [Leptolyngbya iicbica]|uniref:Uncharacterized protein n=2 Tax=Cyanophyceae TaxID=3028117 RepID=A0A4Q7E6C3_9CYAN|nr:hypothetical protein [Leptolyngbya sp. LK]RZM77801.1 hypothetical protein DYY88_14595 [Leptolyngbya sp. LK]